jgi:hypothetical protein
VAIVSHVSASVLSAGRFGIKDIHSRLSIVNVGGSINTAVFPLSETQVIFDNVENLRHLTKNEDLVSILVKPLQHAIHQ